MKHVDVTNCIIHVLKSWKTLQNSCNCRAIPHDPVTPSRSCILHHLYKLRTSICIWSPSTHLTYHAFCIIRCWYRYSGYAKIDKTWNLVFTRAVGDVNKGCLPSLRRIALVQTLMSNANSVANSYFLVSSLNIFPGPSWASLWLTPPTSIVVHFFDHSSSYLFSTCPNQATPFSASHPMSVSLPHFFSSP